MKIRRNQLILLIVIISIAVWFFISQRETYDVSQSKEALIEYINKTPEPDAMFVMSSISEMTKDTALTTAIFQEADKGDLADKKKLTDLIKKI